MVKKIQLLLFLENVTQVFPLDFSRPHGYIKMLECESL